jgi:hypothetical protein
VAACAMPATITPVARVALRILCMKAPNVFDVIAGFPDGAIFAG